VASPISTAIDATTGLRTATTGLGPTLLLIHGAAADHTTWMGQLVGLPHRFSIVAHDRRGAASAPLSAGEIATTERHADDAAALLTGRSPALVCGSSYGAVVALELARRAPDRVAGLVLCEPPIPASDLEPGAPAGFGCAFDRLVATAGGEAAAEMFLRAVLGNAAFDGIPARFRGDLTGKWRSIRADMIALARYRVDFGRIGGQVTQPCLLLGGERSPPQYDAALEALARALPDARRDVIPKAGHAMQIDNHRVFNRVVVAFAGAIGHRAAA
jgi:pimeloyl-ACP methyl ester carboxylesterase